MAMTLAQAQGVMRQLHGQYTTEKAAIAYLDEMLTAITENTEQIAAMEQSKHAAEAACVAVQAKLDGLEAEYAERVRDMDALYATVKAEMAQKIDEVKSVYAKAQQDAKVYQAQLALEEHGYTDRVMALRESLTLLQGQKQALDEQVTTLHAKVRAIRESMAGVPA